MNDKLHILQKKAVRIITSSSYFAHSEPLFKQLRLLKTCDIYKCQLLKFIFKLTHKQLPHYFEQFTFIFRNQTTPPEPVKTYLFLMLITNSQKGVYGSSLHQHITLPVETLLTKYTRIVLLDLYIYVKFQLIDSYNIVCSTRNCFSCRRHIQ